MTTSHPKLGFWEYDRLKRKVGRGEQLTAAEAEAARRHIEWTDRRLSDPRLIIFMIASQALPPIIVLPTILWSFSLLGVSWVWGSLVIALWILPGYGVAFRYGTKFGEMRARNPYPVLPRTDPAERS